jgi:hypothetical protein
MKTSKVNKLYSQLTPKEQAALVFEATVRRNNDEADAITASVPVQTYPRYHFDYMNRSLGLWQLTGFYGTIYFKTRTMMLSSNNPARYLALIASMDAALVAVCDRVKVGVDAIKTQALCLNEPVFSDYSQEDLVDEYAEIFQRIVG